MESDMASSSSFSSSSSTIASFRIEVNPFSFKAVSSVLTFVSKVGKELIMEVEKDRLTFRALNDAKSVRTIRLYIIPCQNTIHIILIVKSSSYFCLLTQTGLCSCDIRQYCA